MIWSATDLEPMQPVIRAFLEARPGVAVVYNEMQTLELHSRILEGQGMAPDIALSSAADLQVKLANDGLASEHQSLQTERLPKWANWRNQAFGFTFEPAVMVFNRSLLKSGDLPRTRHRLSAILDADPAKFQGRVATYDISKSGIGYLFATHDAMLSSSYPTFMRSLGKAGVRLYCCTAEVLDAIDRGDVLVGYNLLGSYAMARAQKGSEIEVVMPEDYTLVVARVAILPSRSVNPALGRDFLDFLLSPAGQGLLASRSHIAPIDRSVTGTISIPGIEAKATGPLQPIHLGSSLLVFLDRLKQERFIRNWRNLISAEP